MLTSQTQDSFASSPPLDIVLTGANTPGHKANEAELAFLRQCDAHGATFLSVCFGVEPIMAAGLLEGKTATGPRILLPMLREQAPGTNWVEKRWTRDGRFWSSGALLNGLDMVAAFATEMFGGEGTLTEFLLRLGSYPIRDIEYKDVPWKI